MTFIAGDLVKLQYNVPECPWTKGTLFIFVCIMSPIQWHYACVICPTGKLVTLSVEDLAPAQ
jgi:hypothetical protein